MQPFVTQVRVPAGYAMQAARVVRQVGTAQRFGFYSILGDAYFGPLRERFPHLHHGLHVFTSTAGDPWKIHTDTWPDPTERQCALNFGVRNCGKWGVTRFYSEPQEGINQVSKAGLYSTLIGGPLQLMHEHYLHNGEACIIDSLRPHSVTNDHSQPRIVLSWGISLPYEQAVPAFLSAFA